MKTVQISRPGAPDVLECVEKPVPVPGANEVLVRAHSIGVGIPDILIRNGSYAWMPALPALLGTEMAGTIEAVGSGAGDLAPGRPVLVSTRETPRRGGCYAEFIATTPDTILPLPAGLDLGQACALSNYQVAYHLLHDASHAAKGQSALVYAAAGGVGSVLVELAARAGLDVIGVVGGAAKRDFVRNLGARAAIDRHAEDIAERTLVLTGGRGVDLVFDSVGGAAFAGNLELMAPFGLLVSYGRLAGPPQGDMKALRAHLDKSLAMRAFSMHTLDEEPDYRLRVLNMLIGWMMEGTIRPRIHGRVKLAEARAAHEMLEAGTVMGKLVLEP